MCFGKISYYTYDCLTRRFMQSIPHKDNFCGGNFKDWIEVMLTEKCNAHCAWCVEKKGWHPSTYVGWERLAEVIYGTRAKNVILLGGEPTLFPDLENLINRISMNRQNVWITTNGSKLTKEFASTVLKNVTGVNISLHDWDLDANFDITGIKVKGDTLREAIKELHKNWAKVRFNCNLIKGHIDNSLRIESYIQMAKEFGVDSVRFAELKDDKEDFVDLAKIMNYEYGLSDDPFFNGCVKECIIDGMPVNFRQMCGIQTCMRKKPENPLQCDKRVVYYDGIVHDGWQIKKEKENMKAKELVKVLNQVKSGTLDVAEAAVIIDRAMHQAIDCGMVDEDEGSQSGGGCRY